MKKILIVGFGILLMSGLLPTKTHAFTLGDVMLEITSLKKQVAELKQNMGGQVLGASTDIAGDTIVSRDLSAGIKEDTDVLKLQSYLQNKGYPITPDGNYGPKTQSTVKQFQAANNLPVTGTVDSTTRTIINNSKFQTPASSIQSTGTTPITKNDTAVSMNLRSKGITPADSSVINNMVDKLKASKAKRLSERKMTVSNTGTLTPPTNRVPGHIGWFVYATCFVIGETGSWSDLGSGWINTGPGGDYFNEWGNIYFNWSGHEDIICIDWGETGEI